MRKLNPGYKLLTLIIASLLLSVTFHVELNLLVCLRSLLTILFTPGVNRKRLLLTLIPAWYTGKPALTKLAGLCNVAIGVISAFLLFPALFL